MNPFLNTGTTLGIGLITGVVTGLTGASGVVIVVPLLTLLLGFSIYSAIGTSLIVDVVASVVVSYTYYKHGNIQLKKGIWLATSSIAGAQIGARISTSLPEGGLGAGFGLSMILMGVFILTRLRKKTLDDQDGEEYSSKITLGQIAKVVMLGGCIGIITGLIGAGGGMMFLFVLIFILDFPLHAAIGTSTFIMAITAMSGAVGYGIQGEADLAGGILVGLSSIAGGMIGARTANRFSEHTLTVISGSLFIAIGVVMTAITIINKIII